MFFCFFFIHAILRADTWCWWKSCIVLATPKSWVQIPGSEWTDKMYILSAMYCKSLWLKAFPPYINVKYCTGQYFNIPSIWQSVLITKTLLLLSLILYTLLFCHPSLAASSSDCRVSNGPQMITIPPQSLNPTPPPKGAHKSDTGASAGS